jgi:integrase
MITGTDTTSANFIAYMEYRVGQRRIAHDTARQHMMVVRFLRDEYGKIQTFSDLTRQKLLQLDEYLHHRVLPDGRYMAQPSIYKYHKVIKIYINDAIDAGIMQENPYDQLKITPGTSKTRAALTPQELAQFAAFVPPTEFLQKVKDLFLVQCYTGLAYVDLMGTDFTQAECVDGEYVLNRTLRQKTGTRFIIVLLPPVLAILRKYHGHLPHLAYDVYNRHLKALAIAAGITKTVTTHIGRHTFATTVALGSGIPIEVLSKMLGHTNIKTTQIYAKILPAQVMDAFDRIKNRM